MEPNMSRSGKNVYRINQGGVLRHVRGVQAKANIQREMHGVAIAGGTVAGRVPAEHADWFYDLRRKQNRVYGGLLRFIDTSAALGTPKEVIDQIPRLLASYIADVFEDRDRAA